MTFLGMPAGSGHLRGQHRFPEAARAALDDAQLRHNLGNATLTIRRRRQAVVDELSDWEQLRAAGAAIKDDALANLEPARTGTERAALAGAFDPGGLRCASLGQAAPRARPSQNEHDFTSRQCGEFADDLRPARAPAGDRRF